jgi:hypothetical protein
MQHNVTSWGVRVTIVAVETQQCVACTDELHVTVNNIRILRVAQKCFYGEFMSPAAMKLTWVFT